MLSKLKNRNLSSKFFWFYLVLGFLLGTVESLDPLLGLFSLGLSAVFYFLALLGILPVAGPVIYWLLGNYITNGVKATMNLPVTCTVVFVIGLVLCLIVQLVVFLLLLLFFKARDVFEKLMRG